MREITPEYWNERIDVEIKYYQIMINSDGNHKWIQHNTVTNTLY
jgi:hypothetical protein